MPLHNGYKNPYRDEHFLILRGRCMMYNIAENKKGGIWHPGIFSIEFKNISNSWSKV